MYGGGFLFIFLSLSLSLYLPPCAYVSLCLHSPSFIILAAMCHSTSHSPLALHNGFNFPFPLYRHSVMRSAWRLIAEERPTFEEVVDILSQFLHGDESIANAEIVGNNSTAQPQYEAVEDICSPYATLDQRGSHVYCEPDDAYHKLAPRPALQSNGLRSDVSLSLKEGAQAGPERNEVLGNSALAAVTDLTVMGDLDNGDENLGDSSDDETEVPAYDAQRGAQAVVPAQSCGEEEGLYSHLAPAADAKLTGTPVPSPGAECSAAYSFSVPKNVKVIPRQSIFSLLESTSTDEGQGNAARIELAEAGESRDYDAPLDPIGEPEGETENVPMILESLYVFL